MATILLDPQKGIGKIKPMHCVNNGPVKARGDQVRGHFAAYKAAKIPYMRNHDASFCAAYGGEHTVDVHLIFPDFSRDESDPAAYDFQLTDEYLANTLSAGTKIFYRLGAKIEHETKKYGTPPPPDFDKWARVCEHIIRHYNEGWNRGFTWNIEYWEIWNEPDGGADETDPVMKKTWGGTREAFFRLFEITAKHLKSCFPQLKIGGPATCGSPNDWVRAFFDYLQARAVPLDFFSWHNYATTPQGVCYDSAATRALMDSHGYARAESICNEWNYVINWDTRFIESIETIISLKGAAFTAASMLLAQNRPIDMLMYYDARPCPFNGLFDFYTLRPLKGYYPFHMFSQLYKRGTQVEAQSDDADVYAVAARDENGLTLMAANYNNDAPSAKTLTVRGLSPAARAYILDETRDCALLEDAAVSDGALTLPLPPYAVLLIVDG